MTPALPRDELEARFFQVLLETVLTLKDGPDTEVILEALVGATASLKEHLEQELEEIRLEQAE